MCRCPDIGCMPSRETMDIAIIVPEMVSRGGCQKFVWEVSRIWEKRHGVRIYTLYWNEKSWQLNDVFCLKRRDAMTSAFNLYSPFLIKRLEKHAKGDVFNTHMFPANWFGKKPNVWYAHEPPRMLYDLKEDVMSHLGTTKKAAVSAYFPMLAWMDRRESKRNVDRFVGNSRYCAGYLRDVYGAKADFVYPGVDIKNFKSARLESPILLSVGRLHTAKRMDMCIKAMGLISKAVPEVELRIVGEGPERKKLEALAERLGVSCKIKFLGDVGDGTLRKEYETAYAVLYPPLREPFGLVPIEAGASGKPVIAVNEGGCRESVQNGKNGILVPPTADSMATAAITLLQDKKLAGRMGANGRKRAKEFSWKRTAKELLYILKSTQAG